MTEEILRQNLIATCRGEVGVKEYPPKSNSTKYGIWYGMDRVAWCCIWISWILDAIGISDMKEIKGYKKGFSHTKHIMDYAKKYNLFTENPQKGDIAMVDFKTDEYIDHIAFFEKFKTDSRDAFLYEGNTSMNNKESQANGGEVCYKFREEHYIVCYISISKLLQQAVK